MESRAGLVCHTQANQVAQGLDKLEADWTEYSQRARALAEQSFDSNRFVAKYRQLYEEVLVDGAARFRLTGFQLQYQS